MSSWSPYKVTSRAKWHAILLAQRIGSVAFLPHIERVPIDDAQGINWRAIGWTHNTPPVPVIYIGSPGPHQKAIIHLADPASGKCAAVVKLPLQAQARAAIIQESLVLSTLEEESYPFAPRLLYLDDLHGVATQRFVAGRSGSRKFRGEYQDLLRSLMLPGESTTLAGHACTWHEHPLWDFLEPAEHTLLESAMSEHADMTVLPACWLHGDFAPWNIRDRDHQQPALIDWEMAERGALPLLDAFHFLHIQRYLFGHREKSTFADLAPFARTLGISAKVCRKLEIAYLIRSYFSCMEWGDRWRAQSLLKTLGFVLSERTKATACGGDDRRLRLVASRPTNHRTARLELFSDLVAELNRSGMPYCVLSGHETTPETNASDVDIMFLPKDVKDLPKLLARLADSIGAHLVQAIHHETSACYFVLAKVHGKHVSHLAVDCYGDYRRDDRTWLLAADMLAKRRKYRNIYRPSLADEFIYCLIKKVMKNSLSASHLKHLQHLFARDATICREQMRRFWSHETAAPLERNLVDQNLGWFRKFLPKLCAELWRSRASQRWGTRLSDSARNGGRLLHRILFPTGMFLSIVGDGSVRQEELADRLLCALAPAFRRTQRLVASRSVAQSLLRDVLIRQARIRSTLVVATADAASDGCGNSLSSGRRTHSFSRPDLVLHLHEGAAAFRNATLKENYVWLDAHLSADQLAEQANAAILRWLAFRTHRRFRIPEFAPQPMAPVRQPDPSTECQFVGSD